MCSMGGMASLINLAVTSFHSVYAHQIATVNTGI